MKKSKNLKRSGSPNLSESSGNESSRKKHKKKHVSSSQPTGASTPIPGQPQRKSSIVKMSVSPNELSRISSSAPNPQTATSDGEATGGEMSDGAGSKKKITLRMGGSPTTSRPGSPIPGKSSGSRAGSPSQGAGKNVFLCSTSGDFLHHRHLLISLQKLHRPLVPDQLRPKILLVFHQQVSPLVKYWHTSAEELVMVKDRPLKRSSWK